MQITVSKKDIVWSYTSQILNYGSGVIILPLILKLLSTKEVGLWYIFMSITALVGVMDFGFMPNITRSISYIYSGAKYLSKEGVIQDQFNNDINTNLLKSVIYVVQRIYKYITIVLIVILMVGGTFYLRSIIKPTETSLWLAFYVFTTSVTLNFFYSYYDALLLGRGSIKEANQAISISKMVFLVLSSIGISLHYGLLSIAVANLGGTFVNRVLYYRRFYNPETKELLKDAVVNNTKSIFDSIWFNARKLGIISIGVFLMFQANLLIAAKYFTIVEVAQLGLVIQLFSTLQNFARLYFTTHIPRFNSLRMLYEMTQLKLEFSKSMIIGWIVYLNGACVIIFFGSMILVLIKSKTGLPDSPILILFAVVYLMEITHGNCAVFLTTNNTVPFLGATIFSSLSTIVLNLVFMLVFKFGLMGFALSTIIVQLSYNAWKWPYEVLKYLNVKFSLQKDI